MSSLREHIYPEVRAHTNQLAEATILDGEHDRVLSIGAAAFCLSTFASIFGVLFVREGFQGAPALVAGAVGSLLAHRTTRSRCEYLNDTATGQIPAAVTVGAVTQTMIATGTHWSSAAMGSPQIVEHVTEFIARASVVTGAAAIGVSYLGSKVDYK